MRSRFSSAFLEIRSGGTRLDHAGYERHCKDFLPEDLLPLLQAAKIDGCVAVQADQSEAETHFLLTLADRNPFIQGVVGWADLRAANLDERLEYYSQFKKLKGFRHVVQGEPKGFLANGTFMAGVRKLARYNFTYDILIYHHHLDEAVAFARAIDNVKMVVDHVAKPAIREGVITRGIHLSVTWPGCRTCRARYRAW